MKWEAITERGVTYTYENGKIVRRDPYYYTNTKHYGCKIVAGSVSPLLVTNKDYGPWMKPEEWYNEALEPPVAGQRIIYVGESWGEQVVKTSGPLVSVTLEE